MENRLTLKKMILNIIEKMPRGYINELADIAGYTGKSKGSNFKRVLIDEKKEFDDFGKLVELVKFLFGNDEKKLLEEYSKSIKPTFKTAKAMLEYLSSNRLLDSMKQLIDKMLECKSDESIEWATVYSLQYEWHVNYYNLEIETFINTINNTKTNINELKVYLQLLKFYSFYHKQNYKLAYEFSKLISYGIDDIKDDYIRKAYTARFSEALSYIYLRVLNKPEESREKSDIVLETNIGLGAISYAHYNIGCSYMFSSYDESLKYLNESIRLYQSAERESVVKDIKEKVDLLNVMWNKEEAIYTITAKLLQESKRGTLQEKDLDKFKDEIDLSFYYLIKGIKDNDNDFLLHSVIEFLRIGDTFMGNLPKLELLKRGYNEGLLNALTGLNQA